MNKTVSILKVGEKAHIIGFKDSFIEEKLTEMGCLIGDDLIVLKKAPLGDPIFIQIGCNQLGLRIAEAMEIEVK